MDQLDGQELDGALAKACGRYGYVGDIDPNLALISSLMQQGANPQRSEALLHAARLNQPVTIELLVRMGAGINFSNRHGNTALHTATLCAGNAARERLIHLGADENQRNLNGHTPYEAVANKYSHECGENTRPLPAGWERILQNSAVLYIDHNTGSQTTADPRAHLIQCDDVDTTCAICLGEVYSQPVKLECGHGFCSSCINKHAEFQRSCPLCRRPIQGSVPVASRELQQKANVIREREHEKRRQEDWEDLLRDTFQISHTGIACNLCDVCPIVGRRWEAIHQPEFDICDPCYKRIPPAGQDLQLVLKLHETRVEPVSNAELDRMDFCYTQTYTPEEIEDMLFSFRNHRSNQRDESSIDFAQVFVGNTKVSESRYGGYSLVLSPRLAFKIAISIDNVSGMHGDGFWLYVEKMPTQAQEYWNELAAWKDSFLGCYDALKHQLKAGKVPEPHCFAAQIAFHMVVCYLCDQESEGGFDEGACSDGLLALPQGQDDNPRNSELTGFDVFFQKSKRSFMKLHPDESCDPQAWFEPSKKY